MAPIHLIRIDEAVNMARFYRIAIEPTLFETVALTRNWGRIGTWGQTRTALHDTYQDALREQAQFVKKKLSRGYRHIPVSNTAAVG